MHVPGSAADEGELTELVPVPDFKSAVTVREYGEVSSILMLSRQFFKYLTTVNPYSTYTAKSRKVLPSGF
jgi:hypothetical protein